MAEKPKVERPKLENIPQTLQDKGKFCCWRYEPNDKGDGWKKVPYNPTTGRRGNSTDPAAFTDIAQAWLKSFDFDGVGVGIFDNLAGIDIDHCIDPNGQLSEMAADIVETMNAYTEKSPSGTGIRILFTVSDGFDYDTKDTYYIKNSAKGLEVYVAGKTKRILTVTGNTIKPSDLDDRTKELQIVLDKYMQRPERNHTEPTEAAPVDLSDMEIIDKALSSKNGDKFQELWAGNISGYPSHSEADQAFCNMLAFWTGGDPLRIDSIFRQSGLMRSKWNRDDYRNGTIKNAIANCSEYYKQGGETVEPSDDRTKKETPANTVETGLKSIDVGDYLTEGAFEKDIQYFQKYKDRKTGFSNIDEHLTLYPGLAFLGGAASLGKSTFVVQLADNLIEQGETVIYFALEQTPVELITKSLARRLAAVDPGTPLDNIDIKNGATSPTLEKVKKDYAASVKDKFFIMRCDFTTTAADIQDKVETYIKQTGRRPVVIVDYLQLIAPPDDFRGDTRAATDLAIKTLKTMQLKNELLLIVVSNFNRSGYDSPVSYSDFKESSLIEYSADYLWALQLSIVSKAWFSTKLGPKGGQVSTTDQDKDALIDEAINRNPKQVQFVSLKSRNGKQRYTCELNYYMKYDYFKPADADGFTEMDPSEKSVFDGIEPS